MIQFLRQQWVPLVFLAAMAFSIFLGITRPDTRKVRQAAIAACVLEAERDALVLAFAERVAGEALSENLRGEYRALARGVLLLLPVPPRGDRKQLTEVVEVRSEGGRSYQLSSEANKLIREGCQALYR